MNSKSFILCFVLLSLLTACSSVVHYEVNGPIANEENQKEIFELALSEVKDVFNHIDFFVVSDCHDRKSELDNEKTINCKTVRGVKKPYSVSVRVYSDKKAIILKYVSSGVSKNIDDRMRNQIIEAISDNKYQVRIIRAM